MRKNSFYVIEYRSTTTGKYYSIALKKNNCVNLIGLMEAPKNYEVVSINACDSWREAQEVADVWNNGAKARGLYAFM